MIKIKYTSVLLVILMIFMVMMGCTHNNDFGYENRDEDTSSKEDLNQEEINREEIGQDSNKEDNVEQDEDKMNNVVKIIINGNAFDLMLYDNDTTKELKTMLPMTIKMNDMTHEKYCYLDTALPTHAEDIKNIAVGDVMLWGNSCLVVFYESFSTSYQYTKIGKIINITGLASSVGSGSSNVTIDRR